MEKCILCEEEEQTLKTELRKVTYKGKEIEYEHKFYYCSVYDEKFEQGDLIDVNLNEVKKVYILNYASSTGKRILLMQDTIRNIGGKNDI